MLTKVVLVEMTKLCFLQSNEQKILSTHLMSTSVDQMAKLFSQIALQKYFCPAKSGIFGLAVPWEARRPPQGYTDLKARVKPCGAKIRLKQHLNTVQITKYFCQGQAEYCTSQTTLVQAAPVQSEGFVRTQATRLVHFWHSLKKNK